jgi:hypothetical protein
MKVQNMTSSRGNKIANQFIITIDSPSIYGNFKKRETFQSYDTVICVKTVWPDETRIELDKNNWDYSNTTGKYRNQFLGETKKETEAKIKTGEYILTDLN